MPMTKSSTTRTLPFLTPGPSSVGPAAERTALGIKKPRIKSFRTAAKPTFQWIRGELIGKGSYGRVYMALNASTGEVMAVKQVEVPHQYEKTSEQKEVIDALKFEGETLESIEHPNIVQFLGYEESQDCWSMFLEYVPGGTIETCLRRHGPFSEDLTKSFTTQMLRGLDYLHNGGIMHRDLKSANILVEQAGVCKISDFGVSKHVDLLEAQKAFTGLKGTAFWMAPEVVDSQKAGYDLKVDIWSVGCIVLEMWTGKRPWYGQEVVAVMLELYQHRSAPPLPANHPQLSPLASDFRERCFMPQPSERPTTAELLEHPYLVPDPEWSFTPSELEVRHGGSSPPQSSVYQRRQPKQLTVKHAKRVSVSVPPPADRQPYQPSSSETQRPTPRDGRMLPGPPLVYITPPQTPADTTDTSASDEVFNWADAPSIILTGPPTGTQPRRNFYVVNPDSSDSDSDDGLGGYPRQTVKGQGMMRPASSLSLRAPPVSPSRSLPTPSPQFSHSTARLDTGTAHGMTMSSTSTPTQHTTATALSSVWQRPPLPPLPSPPGESPWHRPDIRNVYAHLEDYFPEHDIDKPVVEEPSEGFFKQRQARRSIRMVANERLNENLNRRGTKVLGCKIEELVIH